MKISSPTAVNMDNYAKGRASSKKKANFKQTSGVLSSQYSQASNSNPSIQFSHKESHISLGSSQKMVISAQAQNSDNTNKASTIRRSDY